VSSVPPGCSICAAFAACNISSATVVIRPSPSRAFVACCLLSAPSWRWPVRRSRRGRFITFYQEPAFETGTGPDQGDQVGCVDDAPAFLGGFDELERYREGGRTGSGASGDLGAQPDRAERGLDGYLELAEWATL
jgi:hypothetical protein